jgi:hypothetical protein
LWITLALLKSPVLWRQSNDTFVSAMELRISIYVGLGVFLALRHRGWG